MQNHSYFVYILASDSGTLYIGVTNNLERRLSEHKQGQVEGFTQKYGCSRLVYYEDYHDIKQAIAREKYLKGKTRKFKEELIKTVNPHWNDLSVGWELFVAR
ncbi:MAG: GIY-YIG nuclease family protein [Candidatus Magasanikbacteria bacterium]